VLLKTNELGNFQIFIYLLGFFCLLETKVKIHLELEAIIFILLKTEAVVGDQILVSSAAIVMKDLIILLVNQLVASR
jgi:hypothetical protein